MPSKSELIKKFTDGWVGGMTLTDEKRIVYPAMDEYAKEMVIGFIKWKDGLELIKEKSYNHYLINYSMGEWSLFAKDEEELFNKYLRTLPQ